MRHLIMGQFATTQNLVAIKEVRHAGQTRTAWVQGFCRYELTWPNKVIKCPICGITLAIYLQMSMSCSLCVSENSTNNQSKAISRPIYILTPLCWPIPNEQAPCMVGLYCWLRRDDGRTSLENLISAAMNQAAPHTCFFSLVFFV